MKILFFLVQKILQPAIAKMKDISSKNENPIQTFSQVAVKYSRCVV